MTKDLMGERLLRIFKQKYDQGDSYYVRVNNKGDKFIVGYKNDYPMQHGDGVEWIIPSEVVKMLVSQVEPEVKPACENCEKYFNRLLGWIKNDIEYGYTPKMILNKIENKNYDINRIDLNSESV